MSELVSRDEPPAEGPLLEARAVGKRFGSFVALDAVDLAIERGRIHALLGENGAGKSTLVKIIGGLLQPDAGELRIRGEPVMPGGLSAARARGIATVSQHFALCDNLTVADNIAISLDERLSHKALSERLAQVCGGYGLSLDPRREVWRLSAGERQRIEIVRALMQAPRLLILDEPTAVLTPQEAERLFAVLQRLRHEGCALLYISHKLDEVKRLADTATILRGGRNIASCDPRDETAASLARMMVGTEVAPSKRQVAHPLTAARLSVRGFSLAPDDPHGVALDDISFEVRGGEILGIAGVAGNGQDELFAALSGERTSGDGGAIRIDDKPVDRLRIDQRRRLGAAFVPEQRLGHATVPGMRLSDNAVLTGHGTAGLVRYGFIDTQAALAQVDRVTATYAVRKPHRDPDAALLSGGNLQKFIIGREILRRPRLLVVDQPCWGLDAAAVSAIRQALLDLALEGAAVLVISQDLDELIEIADRIAVMFEGRLSVPLTTRDTDRGSLGLLMGGGGFARRGLRDAVDA
jgi:general nucleoside transport system ATP-binding protein